MLTRHTHRHAYQHMHICMHVFAYLNTHQQNWENMWASELVSWQKKSKTNLHWFNFSFLCGNNSTCIANWPFSLYLIDRAAVLLTVGVIADVISWLHFVFILIHNWRCLITNYANCLADRSRHLICICACKHKFFTNIRYTWFSSSYALIFHTQFGKFKPIGSYVLNELPCISKNRDRTHVLCLLDDKLASFYPVCKKQKLRY